MKGVGMQEGPVRGYGNEWGPCGGVGNEEGPCEGCGDGAPLSTPCFWLMLSLELGSWVHLSGSEMGRSGYTNTRHTGGWEQGFPLAVCTRLPKTRA